MVRDHSPQLVSQADPCCSGLTNQHSHTSLIAIEGCKTKDEAKFYLGKRIAFVYKAQTLKKGTYFRCIWGKVRALPRSSWALEGVRGAVSPGHTIVPA